MPRPSRLLAVSALGCIALSGAAGALDRSVTLNYRGTLAAMTVGTASAVISTGAAGYRVDGRVATQGPLNFVLPWNYEAISYGRLSANGPAADRFWGSGQSGREPRHIQVTYTKDGAKIDSANPDPAEKPKRVVPPELRRGTVDPLSAMVGVGQRIAEGGRCTGQEVAVFDGRVRYDLHFRDDAAVNTPASSNAALRCRFFYVPIAGFKENHKARAASRESPGIVWFQRVRPDLPAVPSRIEVDSDWGYFVLDLIEAAPGPGQTASRQ